MKKLKLLFLLCLLCMLQAHAADTTRLYNPAANANRDIAALLVKARAEGKHVLIQVGGNWCVMCYRLNAMVQTDTLLRQTVFGNYFFYHLNYSKENKNLDILAKLQNPQRFGFPVLVVLDGNGNRLHTQNSGLLQKGNGYDRNKIKAFLDQWAPNEIKTKEYSE